MAEYSREIIGTLMLGLVPMFALFAWLAVRRERAKQVKEIELAPDVPSRTEIDYSNSNIFYVSTTFAASPLRRVWAYGLGSRGRAHLRFSEHGLEIHRQGERGLFLPWSVTSVATGQATIDRGTESNGLVQLLWTLGDAALLTSIRVVSVAQHKEIVAKIEEYTRVNSK